MCGVSYDHRVTLHDHIFTTGHINRVKKLLQTDNIQTEGPIYLNAPPETTDKEDIQRTRFPNFSASIVNSLPPEMKLSIVPLSDNCSIFNVIIEVSGYHDF